MAKRLLIMGAAGKDFHVFNTCYRENRDVNVVAFTATQIPDIDGRQYPAELAGSLYPDGIPIKAESELVDIIKAEKVDEVIFAYSDVRYSYIEERQKMVEAAGATFALSPVDETMVKSTKPVIAICAVRTGCGKSQTTRRVAEILKGMGKQVVAIRHPMPYGDLVAQKVQRYATIEDMKKHECTIEEMEEYEPHINQGTILYAGVDYEAIVREAEKEADVILWDGGNNDIPFYKPDLWITVADPHRSGHELTYYPGKDNFTRCDSIVINKVDSAKREDVDQLLTVIKEHNPTAVVLEANSPCVVEAPEMIKGKKVVVVEDGPTLTHGEMTYGAGVIAAQRYEAAEIVDPKPYFEGEMASTLEKYPHIGNLIPAMGYSEKQLEDLEKTIARVPCDTVVIGTPINLTRVIKIDKPNVRVAYSLEEITKPGLEAEIRKVIKD